MPRGPVTTEAEKQRRGRQVGGLSAAEAKERVVALIAEGNTNESAIAKVGRSLATYNQWRQREALHKTKNAQSTIFARFGVQIHHNK